MTATPVKPSIGRWGRVTVGITAVLALCLVAATVTLVALQRAMIQSDARQYSTLFDRYTSLYEQLEAHGVEPAAPAPAALPGPRGEEGPTGPEGPGASDSQVLTQVERFCSSTGFCVGAQGPPGTNGAAGQSISGPQGDTGVQGPQGDTGPQGAQGDPGRGISSTVCDDSGEWQVTYTDGTTQDAGSCRPSLLNR